MYGKAEDKLKEAAGAAQETWGDASDSPEHKVKGAARKYSAQAGYAARDVADSVKDQVQSNPFAGLAVAAGIGVFIGYLLGRK
ncbi:glycine zipper domain-containing protein [Pantoea sp.]|uniref:DUF883 family protein n=1 Tax=Pantoea sp. TaxID=69393 RepID=UPI00289F0FA8|nr:CsbD family protein [Pantoea sp.]